MNSQTPTLKPMYDPNKRLLIQAPPIQMHANDQSRKLKMNESLASYPNFDPTSPQLNIAYTDTKFQSDFISRYQGGQQPMQQ